ncbi:hypothetical protein [Pyxidicoccus xibeiensis]|uniref:hypothetical protein n=1 Tax=Pyxidicoccus xibeiensis TaxID=2906759 RepID=UPI0020A7B786|nr:hypothetical protein [Pyxidicoccus xibeiensis]MCP3138754.1 hypothetical protein [Pyxidicoccus xibeiensis]
MPVERTAGSTSLVDVLDRVMDRGLRWESGTHAVPGQPPPDWSGARIVVTFMDVRTDDPPGREAAPRPPSPGA